MLYDLVLFSLKVDFQNEHYTFELDIPNMALAPKLFCFLVTLCFLSNLAAVAAQHFNEQTLQPTLNRCVCTVNPSSRSLLRDGDITYCMAVLSRSLVLGLCYFAHNWLRSIQLSLVTTVVR